MSTIDRAIAIAAGAHAGQVDKAGAPYILHVLRVMLSMTTLEEQVVAVLHDVVEDTLWSLDKLRAEGFSEDVLRAVDSLTHREGESYESFVQRAGRNDLARRVKLADLRDNCNLERIPKLTQEDYARIERYHRAIRQLKGHATSSGP
ncbi:MAG: HD domain-containing protein [Acidobacteria bacterium]|jgi:(p)ppGpp synthase/HD superfamily hydrolase|nr:HD domain-containing protein [Acidobacteriota bacterium]